MSVQLKPLFFEFDEFRLDAERRLLLRDNELVSLTPKVFDLLLVLIENRGEVVSKDHLMQELWSDSFVEEANIAQNVAVLRRALGETSKENKFIATVPGRGYRFVANVKLVRGTEAQKETVNIDPETQATPSGAHILTLVRPTRSNIQPALEVAELPQPQNDPVPAPINDAHGTAAGENERPSDERRISMARLKYAVGFVVLVIVVLAAFAFNRMRRAESSVFGRTLSVARLSTDGGVPLAVISSDGEQIYYVRVLGDIQSIRVRDIETDNDSEIIEGAKVIYNGLDISPDGKALFSIRSPYASRDGDLFRMAIPGGIPRIIARHVEGRTAVSPDGSKISFVRCPWLTEDNCSLFVADAVNGSSEQKLLTRPSPILIGDSVFTPDGEDIVFANGQSQSAGKEYKLSKVHIDNGYETEFSPERFFIIKNLAWAPGTDSPLMTAARGSGDRYVCWKLDAYTGKAVSIDKLEAHFVELSLDRTGSSMVSTDVVPDFKLHVYGLEEGATDSILAPGEASNFTPDGKVVFSSNLSGQMDIWTAEADGRGLRRLTDLPSDERAAISSSDGRMLFFASNRSGDTQIWRMNIDGTNPQQLTKTTGGYPVSVTSDDRWVVFESAVDDTLWRIAADGSGQEELVRKNVSQLAAVSPQGTSLAWPDNRGNDHRIFLSEVNNDASNETLIPAQPKNTVSRVRFSNDGLSIFYIQRQPIKGKAVIYKQSLSGGTPVKVREIDIGPTIASYSFAMSPDEKKIIVASGDWRYDLILVKGLE